MWRVDDGRSTIAEVRKAPPHDHAVHVYADDRAISQELVRFVEDGLALGESVVVVANRLNRAAIAAWRAEHPPIGDSDFLLVADASETLETFMVAGKPDPTLFETTIGSILERATRGGRTVRVFGEMVAVLWDAGNVAGALALETLWNDMASDRQFFLMCAYPEGLLDRGITERRQCDVPPSFGSLCARPPTSVCGCHDSNATVCPATSDSGPKRCVCCASDREKGTGRLGAASPHS